MKLRLVLRAAIGAAILLASSAAFAGEMQSLQVGSATREYYLHQPATGLDEPGKRPLVIVLHGAGGWGRQAVRRYNWEDKAEQAHFIVAGPDAWRLRPDQPANFQTNPRFWNDAGRRGSGGMLTIDDVAFISSLIDSLIAEHGVDRSRVYVTGFSSGAGMTQRAAVELAGKIAAAAPVSGIVAPTSDTPSRPVPFLYISGDADPLNPVAGGEVELMLWGVRYPKTSHQAILTRWRALDGCSEREAQETPGAGVSVRIWPSCASGSEVRYVLVQAHGHHWPGEKGMGLPEAMVGPRSRAFDATEAIWQFLSRFHL